MSRVLLAIPARGGSKRLPRKNLLPLGGIPMLAHTVRAAIASQLAADVYVCTEDDEIADAARAEGAHVFRVPPDMTRDEVSSTVPCLALDDHLRSRGEAAEFIFNLQPTSPLRAATDIRSALTTLQQAGVDFLVSVTPIDPHYFHWGLVPREGHRGWGMYFGQQYMKERNQLPPVFRPNGAIKLARAESLRRTGHYFGELLGVLEMPEERSVHVGTAFDFACARALLELGTAEVGTEARCSR